MKIALLHLNLSLGPEKKNLGVLEKAIEIAANKGANWIVTPETAVQGYYFYKINAESVIEQQPSNKLNNIKKLANKYKLHLFLGSSEYGQEDNCNFNTCLVIGPSGELIARHRKLISLASGAEGWATRAKKLEPITITKQLKVGALVCADAWYPEHAKTLKAKGAQILIDIAAWPPTKTCGDPLSAWQRCSAETQLPFILCNQTGENPWMDMRQAESVVIENGKVKLSHSGLESILLFDWDVEKNCLLSDVYEKIVINNKE